MDHAAAREALDLDQNVKRLGKMMGMKSVNRNLEAEDESVRRDYLLQEQLFDGGEATDQTPAKANDDMDIMAARDVIVNYGQQPTASPTPAPAAAASAAPATAPAPATSGLSTAAKAAVVGAALLGTGGLASGVTAYFMNNPATVVEKLKGVVDGLGVSLEPNASDQ